MHETLSMERWHQLTIITNKWKWSAHGPDGVRVPGTMTDEDGWADVPKLNFISR